MSLRDEVDIPNRKYYTTSPPSKVASQGIFQAKEKATLFRGRLYYYITYSVVPSVSYSL